MKQLLSLVFMLLSLACSAQQKGKEKDPFVGKDKREIIREYGQPSVVRHERDGEALIYKRDLTHVSGHSAYTGTKTYTFRLDKNGKVASWHMKPGSQPVEPIIAN